MYEEQTQDRPKDWGLWGWVAWKTELGSRKGGKCQEAVKTTLRKGRKGSKFLEGPN